MPLTIPFKGKMEVQGECYMKLSVLDEINKTTDEKLKNARNAAAGSAAQSGSANYRQAQA